VAQLEASLLRWLVEAGALSKRQAAQVSGWLLVREFVALAQPCGPS
jgi:hypothetical protein